MEESGRYTIWLWGNNSFGDFYSKWWEYIWTRGENKFVSQNTSDPHLLKKRPCFFKVITEIDGKRGVEEYVPE